MMLIDIIGAGIGGLTTAIALQQKGVEIRIFEQAERIEPVGAGIMLANNAMQVYAKLGLKDAIEQNGNPISCMKITDAKLQSISAVDLRAFEERYAVKNVAIHRGALQRILLDQINASHLNLGQELMDVKRDQTDLILKFRNEKTVTSKYLLGADGLHSVVRNCLFNENIIRNAFQTCWRGVVDFTLAEPYKHELNEAWGKGDRFGFVQIAENKVYWYALKTISQVPNNHSTDQLDTYFQDYHALIRDLIESTPRSKIHMTEVSDLRPLTKWYQDQVCLIGDAAHGTTPNMGQGACQAIEDAYVLSSCLEKFEGRDAFANFQRMRMPKVSQVVKRSWTLGKVSHWQNPLAIMLRNQMMKWTSQQFMKRQTEKIFTLET